MSVAYCHAQSAEDPLERAHTAYAAGYQALNDHNLPLARTEFEKVTRLAPQLQEGHNGLGYVLLQTGHPADAAAEFELSIKIAKSQPAEETLASAYAAIPDNARALSALQAAAAIGPLTPEAALLDARLLAAANQPGDHSRAAEEAAIQLRRTLDHAAADPTPTTGAAKQSLAALHDALATALIQRQQWPEAQRQLEDAIALDNDLPAAHEHLGALLLIQHQPETARPELEKAAELDPADVETQVQLGRALVALHRDADALTTLRRAEQLSEKPGVLPTVRTDALFQLGMALQNSTQPGDAVPYFQKVIEAEPNNTIALTNLGLALVQTGKSTEATPYYLRALKLAPKDPTLRLDLGVDYLQRSDLDGAVDQFRAGIALQPDSAVLHYDLGLAFKLKDRLDDSIPELEKAAQLDPSLVDPHVTLGTLYMQQGKFDEAAVEMQAALTAQPDNGDMWATLGSVYKQAGKLPQAEEALRNAIRLLPEQPGAHTTLATVLQEQGRTDEALAERKTAGQLTKGAMSRQAALFATNAGDLLLSKGQVDEAIAQYRTAIKDQPGYLPAHRQLALALDQKGQKTEADAERKIAQQP